MVSGAERLLQFCPPVLPKVGVQFCAVVCHINSPSDFYIQMVRLVQWSNPPVEYH